MAIVRWWDPVRDLSSIQDKMNQLFEDTFTRTKGREEGLGTGMWTPAVDIYETNDSVIVKAELPGLTREQVGIEVKDGLLTLRGERKVEKEVKEENYHRIERAYGTFQRSFSLPSTIDQEKISATLKDGVLELTLPKREQAKPKQITVAVK
ncbi:MAG: Hsp20/alpha crystallin family protein [Deltaproteobacteria bacterium]|nr:Hsp20/alpha crystallin family protein [Deltaproteobacteria bacterium]RJP21017.1 MAG: Hsp20/alpha crystallin family protein [Deltaproteobacteria bacterium]